MRLQLGASIQVHLSDRLLQYLRPYRGSENTWALELQFKALVYIQRHYLKKELGKTRNSDKTRVGIEP